MQLSIEERIIGSKSIWDTIANNDNNNNNNNNKLPTCANTKIVTIKFQSQPINIKAERKLMSLFLVAARSRSEIDLSRYLGKYEFSAVAQSLFSMEGEIFTCKDKSQVVAAILKCWQLEELINIESSDQPQRKVIIFDRMAMANKLNIKKLRLSTCSEYAAKYMKKLFKSKGFSEVQVTFDRYIEKSLKAGQLFIEKLVYCFGTDILLLLLHYFDDTCSSTIFRSTSRDIHFRCTGTQVLNCVRLYLVLTH